MFGRPKAERGGESEDLEEPEFTDEILSKHPKPDSLIVEEIRYEHCSSGLYKLHLHRKGGGTPKTTLHLYTEREAHRQGTKTLNLRGAKSVGVEYPRNQGDAYVSKLLVDHQREQESSEGKQQWFTLKPN